MEIYEIDLVRALFANKLNDLTIFLASFYEQIDDQEQISRYVETIKELIALQNREKEVSTYKAMGIIAQAGDSEILNIKTNYVVPTNYTARFDIELSDRDYVLTKLKALISDLRGRKFEVGQLSSGEIKVFSTPLIYNDTHELPVITSGQYIPYTGSDPISSSANFITHLKTRVVMTKDTQNVDNLIYFPYNSKLYSTTYKHTGWTTQVTNVTAYNASAEKVDVAVEFTSQVAGALTTFLNASGRTHRAVLKLIDLEALTTTYYSINLTTETRTTPVDLGTGYQLFKMSISFNGIQSQEPYINNGVDRVYLFFGGNVTITDEKVMLGNDITQTTIQVGKDTGTIYNVEPNEIPASLALDTDGYGEWGTGYQGKERIIGVANKLSYSFIYDTTNALYNDWYKYSRFGIGSSTYANQIFTIKEYRYSYGVLTVNKFYAKLGEITTQNTNGDVMMLSVAMNVGAY